MRDPDASTEIHMFVDGVRVDAEKYHVDLARELTESLDEHRNDSLKPESWTSDRERCRAAGIADEVGFATNHGR